MNKKQTYSYKTNYIKRDNIKTNNSLNFNILHSSQLNANLR